jgi:hypothetical protein
MRKFDWHEIRHDRMAYNPEHGNEHFYLNKRLWNALCDYCEDNPGYNTSISVINHAVKEKLQNEGYLEVSD